MMNITIFAIASIAALLIYMCGGRFYRFCVYFRRLNKIPGPKLLPFIGVPYTFITKRREDHVNLMRAASLECEDRLLRFWLFFDGAVIVSKPEHVEAILRTNDLITKSTGSQYLIPYLGQGLVTSTGPQHSHDRKLITPTFYSQVMHEFTDVMLKKAIIFNTCIENNINIHGDKPFDIFPMALRCTLDIICETAMGVNIHAQDGDSNNEYINAVEIVSRSIPARILQPWLAPDWIFRRTTLGKVVQPALKIVNDFITRVIVTKQEQRKFSSDQRDDWNGQAAGKRNKKSFLDLLLDANEKDDNPLSLKEIIDHTTTIVIAGYDTSGGLISFTLFAIGVELAVQKRLHAELDEVLGDSDEWATLKLLPKLKYLDRVIKEVLRMYPTAPILDRQVMNDIQIVDHTIPKDTSLFVNILNLHRDPLVWPDPLRFDPDRFLPENMKNRHPYAYIPFSAGSRSCIGQKYAILAVKLAVVQVLRKFNVKSIDNHETVKMYTAVTLKPAQGLYVVMRKRE